MKDVVSAISTIVMAIIGVAILAIIVSPKSSSTNVIAAAGKFLSNLIGAAVSPVSNSK